MTEPRHTHSHIYVHGIDAHRKKRRIVTEPWYIFRQKAVWVTSENGDGRTEKPRYDVP